MKWKICDTEVEFIQGDITKQNTEAIVNAANKQLAPGGGVAGAIHRAAGPKLWEECKELGGCETGKAKITKGYDLPATYVIHTVGPVYSGSSEDRKLLSSCYYESLKVAEKNAIERISFPAISTGAFGYPMKKAAKIAVRTIGKFLKDGSEIKLVRMVLHHSHALKVHEQAMKKIIRNLENE